MAMSRKMGSLWLIAAITFAIGVALQWRTAHWRTEHVQAVTQANAMQAEVARMEKRSTVATTIAELAQRYGVAPEIETKGTGLSLRFTRASANGVFGMVHDAERVLGMRATRLSVAFSEPGAVSGTVELVTK